MGISEIDLDPVNTLGLVLPLGLQHELFEDGVIAGYDAVGHNLPVSHKHTRRRTKETPPYGQNLTPAPILLLAPPHPQPMTAVVYGVRGIECRLEDHACLDLSRRELVVDFFLVVSE